MAARQKRQRNYCVHEPGERLSPLLVGHDPVLGRWLQGQFRVCEMSRQKTAPGNRNCLLPISAF